MLACANANLKVRPEFGTFFADRSWLFIFARKPPTFEMEPFDPEEFGHTLRWRRKFGQLAKVGSTSMKDGLYDWEAEAVHG